MLRQEFRGRGFKLQEHGHPHSLHHSEKGVPPRAVYVVTDYHLRNHRQSVFCRTVVFGRNADDVPSANGVPQFAMQRSPPRDRRSPIDAQEGLLDLRIRCQINFLFRRFCPNRPTGRRRDGCPSKVIAEGRRTQAEQ